MDIALQLSVYQVLLSVVVLSIAYIVRGMAGFGSGLIAIPVLSFIFPLTVIVPIVVLLDYLASLSHGVAKKEAIRWREIAMVLPFSLLGVALAIYVFRLFDVQLLTRFLGIFVILFAFYMLLKITHHHKISSFFAVPAGVFGGLIGTLFGTGGPFYVIYLRLRGLNKCQFRSTFAAIFLLDGSARLVGYFGSSFYSSHTVTLFLLALPIMLLSLYVGGKIHTSISQDTFKRVISVLLIFCGTALLLKT